MLAELLKLGPPTAIGTLVGLGLIAWIEPSGWGGMLIIAVFSIAIAYVCLWMFAKIIPQKPESQPSVQKSSKVKKKRDQVPPDDE